MNIEKITDAFKWMGLFLLHNITAILFLCGLGLIVYSVFMWSIMFGFMSTGIAMIIVALILNSEGG